MGESDFPCGYSNENDGRGRCQIRKVEDLRIVNSGLIILIVHYIESDEVFFRYLKVIKNIFDNIRLRCEFKVLRMAFLGKRIIRRSHIRERLYKPEKE